ncbi:MAG TPA: formate dehydrogenase, partial [Xanthobacteraceae bacterium]|nr:formate dehydrogenase [Xanthobacteraceae bacterium]
MAEKEAVLESGTTVEYDGTAGGWGSLKGIAQIFGKEWDTPAALETLMRQNKPKGLMCTSCSRAKPADHHTFEFCENGAKATLWELTTRRCTPDFFAKHSVTELRDWSDYDLEQQGRLTHPMRYDAASDRYVPCQWDEAFRGIGQQLRSFDPNSFIFYSSGRASLETSYLYALFVRLYGTNNLPDSSNMCHETTGVALKESIDVGVGTEMLTGKETVISNQYHQVKIGGDIAVILGICKYIFAADDAATLKGKRVLDTAFIEQHTSGLDEFEGKVRETSWDEIEAASGLSRQVIEGAAQVYVEADRVIGIFGMGLTQHVHGFQNVTIFMNMMLLRGNIGRDGTGISPVRGHSNVQGQRTVGIADKPELVPLDKIAKQFGFEPPREKGMNTVETCQGIIGGKVKAFIGLGGNFVCATPERRIME